MEQNSINVQLKHQLKGHQGAIYALADGSDINKVLSAGADRKVIEWDLLKGEGKLIANSAATVMSLLHLADQNLLLIGQTEGGVHLIDLKAQKELKYLKGHESYIFDIKYVASKEEFIFACADGSFSVWSAKTYERLYYKSLCQKKLRKMELHEASNRLLISRGDGKLSVFSTEDYHELITLEGIDGFNVARFSPDGKYVIAGDKKAHLHWIQLSDGKFLKSLPAHYWAIYDILYSPNKELFATASRDKIVKLWDAKSLEVLSRLEGRRNDAHTHSVNVLYWKVQNTLVSAGDDATVKVWELKS